MSLRLVDEDGNVLLEMTSSEWYDINIDLSVAADSCTLEDATKAFREVIGALTW